MKCWFYLHNGSKFQAGNSGSELEADGPSLYTCGSSVYHAECESMTASHTYEQRRRRRIQKPNLIEHAEDSEPGQPREPLLSESDGEPDAPWEDVFARAPFRKPRDLVTFSPPNLIVLSGSDEPKQNLFSDDDDNFPTTLQGFTPPNPFENDHFQPVQSKIAFGFEVEPHRCGRGVSNMSFEGEHTEVAVHRNPFT